MPSARPWAAASLRLTSVRAALPWPLMSPASPRRWLLGLHVQHLDLYRRDDLRRAPDQDAADGDKAEGPGTERGRTVHVGHDDGQGDDLDQIGDHGRNHQGLRAHPRGPADHEQADAEELGDDGDADQRADQPRDADQDGAQGDHDRGRDGRQRARAPYDRGVLRQHYGAPGGWTGTVPARRAGRSRRPRGGATREDVPRARQEPVAAPLLRCGYTARFRKGITGLSSTVEGLLVKAITKSLTLSLPDRAQSMTNLGSEPDKTGFRAPDPLVAYAATRRAGWRNPAKPNISRALRGGTAARRGDSVRSAEAKGR